MATCTATLHLVLVFSGLRALDTRDILSLFFLILLFFGHSCLVTDRAEDIFSFPDGPQASLRVTLLSLNVPQTPLLSVHADWLGREYFQASAKPCS